MAMGGEDQVGKDRQALEWLFFEGATSEKKSNVTIDTYEKKIMEIWNVKSRQARTIKRQHEVEGWIQSKKAPKISKIWICFNPKSSLVLPATGALPIQKIYNNIVKEIDSGIIATNTPIATKKAFIIPNMSVT